MTVPWLRTVKQLLVWPTRVEPCHTLACACPKVGKICTVHQRLQYHCRKVASMSQEALLPAALLFAPSKHNLLAGILHLLPSPLNRKTAFAGLAFRFLALSTMGRLSLLLFEFRVRTTKWSFGISEVERNFLHAPGSGNLKVLRFESATNTLHMESEKSWQKGLQMITA